ncbi:Rieske (2Fe-2S) protein [Sphingomonas flavalba]|uniref:Rieske (2Fe-2S) protein n=1 Tax=Sphingomonas flavalba TaxID=2559804 RepID=UPI00109DC2D9|nr:Rieske 2Fe-2S domain-containing protein [Sphingomonas flavalba]
MTRHRVAALDEIPETGNKAFDVDGQTVLVSRSAAGVFATEIICTHAYQSLEGGKVKGAYLFCPVHGVRFCLRDGTPAGNLTKKPIKVYATEIVDGQIFVDLPDG